MAYVSPYRKKAEEDQANAEDLLRRAEEDEQKEQERIEAEKQKAQEEADREKEAAQEKADETKDRLEGKRSGGIFGF